MPISVPRMTAKLANAIEADGRRSERTAAAMAALEAAVKEDYGTPCARHRRRQDRVPHNGRIRQDAQKQLRNWRQRCRRLRIEVEGLKRELAKHTEAKTSGGRLAEEWIGRVIACAPHSSARALASSLHLAAGTDTTTVSRWSVGRIRAAFVEMYQNMVHSHCRDEVLKRQATRRRSPDDFTDVFAVHVQDEAALRLLSADVRDGPSMPRRGRASKVQMNVLDVLVGDVRQHIPTELAALGDKKAKTLATCFEDLLRNLVAKIFPIQPQAEGMATSSPIWLVHIIVGDGIATNEAAARQLWANAMRKAVVPGGRYFLILIKCGNHQAALTAKYAVVGEGAKAVSSDAAACEDVTATCVRLFKYVVGDYYEELVKSCGQWARASVGRNFSLLSSQPQAAALQNLYTKHVVPDAVLQRIADGPVLEEGQREAVGQRWHSFLVDHLLHPDDHPTLTRFFTFRGCVDRMLLMALLEFPVEVSGVKLRDESMKRLRKIQNFFRKPDRLQALRRASLSLQLTGGVDGVMATKEGDRPSAVKLCNFEVHELVEQRLARLLGTLCLDPELELSPATGGLLACAADLLLRLESLNQYPLKLCLLCRKWFPTAFLRQCVRFLQTPPELLDVGFSMQLRELALATGGELQGVEWLCSDRIQDFLTRAVEACVLNSLDAERLAARAKLMVARKVSHIATVSRDLICGRYHAQRLAKAREIAKAEKAVRAARRTTVGSLSFAEDSARPIGHEFGASSSSDRPATGGAQKQYISDNSEMLRRSLGERVARAENDLHSIRASANGVPMSRLDLSMWISENVQELRTRMQEAPQRRRSLNNRLWAREGMHAAAPRLQPQADLKPQLQTEWARILDGRTGWHGLVTSDGGVLFYLLRHRGRSWCVDLSPHRVKGGYVLRQDFKLREQLKPLANLEETLPDDRVKQTVHFIVRGSPATGGGVFLLPEKAAHLIAPLPASKRASRPTDAEELGSDADCEDDIKHDSDVESSQAAVDTSDEGCSSSDESTDSLVGDDDDTVPTKKTFVDDLVKPATGGKSHTVTAGFCRLPAQPLLWSNTYFKISLRLDYPALTAHVLDNWTHPQPEGMGKGYPVTRTLQPSDLGETCEAPVRTMLCLRAWMLWRAGRFDWSSATPSRDRYFREEAARLAMDVRRLQPQADGCLGHADASNKMHTWAPEVIKMIDEGLAPATCGALR